MPASLDIGLLAFLGVLAWASVVDIRRRIIPNAAVVAGIAAWCASVALSIPFADVSFVAGRAAQAFLVSGFALACSLVLDRFAGASSLGGGDVKLLFPIGLFVGAETGLAVLGIACLLALAWCALRFSAKFPVSTFPFAPFLSYAFVLIVMLER